MKKFIVALMVGLMLPWQAFAACDFKTGITQVPGGFLYTEQCHLAVGQMRQSYLLDEQKIADLNKALDLKDITITKSDQRADLWMSTSLKLEERLQTVDQMKKTNEWIYFGLGVLTAFVAASAAHSLYSH